MEKAEDENETSNASCKEGMRGKEEEIVHWCKGRKLFVRISREKKRIEGGGIDEGKENYSGSCKNRMFDDED